MKLRYSVILLFLFYSFTFSQVATTTPAYPTENDSVKIIFDISKAVNKTLLNYTGTVYTHTGVYTNISPKAWSHVIGAWGDNNVQPALTRLGTNLYQLIIPNPRTFYSITDVNEHITSFNLVLRSADGSKQTEDLFITVYQGGVTVKFLTPAIDNSFGDPLRSPNFVGNSDTINVIVKAVANQTAVKNLNLFLNNVNVSSTNLDSISYQILSAPLNSGANLVKAVSQDTSGRTDSSSFVLFKNSDIVDEAPPANYQLGLTYNSGTSATFALFAPYKKFVYLLGSFNDWKVDTKFMLHRFAVTQDSVIWWITFDSLTPGAEASFQYLVDGNIRIADPYSHKILDPSNDQYITSSVYPNLMPYPSGKTDEIVSVLQTNQPQYSWKITNFKRPAKTDLVIYELLVRDFVSTHSYETLTDTLSYLKTLGVNAIELMPVMEFEGNESWGYNPDFSLALDKYYGTRESFKKFIDSCHANGIAVILDVVLNHTMGQSPFARLYWDAVNNRPAVNNPWLNPIPKHDFNVGNDFNHESYQTKYFVDRVNSYWLNEFHIDGFRYDLSKGFTQTNTLGNTSAMAQYDQSRINILTRMANKIWSYDSTAYVILEHFADNSEEKVLCANGMMIWGNLNYGYNEATMGWASTMDISGGSYRNRQWSAPNLVTYMESHDEERLMYKNIQYGNASGSYNVKSLNTGLDRVKLAGAFFFTIPGPKMIWQFGELGYDYSINYNGRVGNKPIKWDYLDVTNRKNLYKVFSYLINLKKNYPAFKSGNFTADLTGTMKKITIYDPSMDVTVIGNFNVTAGDIAPNFSKTGEWYDYFSGDSITVAGINNSITLQPGEFHIYTTAKLPVPEQNILSDVKVENDNTSVVKEYSLMQNYPNPFNPSTNIKFSLPKASNVNLSVYNALGEKVVELINKNLNSGNYIINFNATNLPSGMYIYRIETNGFVSSKKMILIK